MLLKLLSILIVSSLTLCQKMTWGPVHLQPEQIHLSWGADEKQMIVTWLTFDLPKQATVSYGKGNLNRNATGTTSMFMDGGIEKRIMYIHRVTMNDLEPDTRYVYRCGSADGWSPIFNFRTRKPGYNWTSTFCVYGDLGNINGQSIGRIQEQAQEGLFDAILHVGDMAYDLHTDNARVGDQFMRQIEPVAAYIPYQVLPGNHEQAYNFSNYDNRFSMVSSGSSQISNHFWSYDIGRVHLIALSTEFYYFHQYGTHQMENQFRWLQADLEKANRKENREKRPWIVVMGHRPLYMMHYVDNKLIKGHDFGDGKGPQFGLEKLLYDYGVDLEIWAHIHNWQRMWPIYNRTVLNGSMSEPYKNPKAPVHIITGSPGNRELQSPIFPKVPDYIAAAHNDYGYTRMTVINGTHLKIEQISVGKFQGLAGKKSDNVIDEFTIIQENHGSFGRKLKH